MQEYKALILDLDGTLIGPDEKIAPAVAEAVKKVSEHIPVSIATGREPSDVIEYAGQLGLESPQISDNGALILDPTTGVGLWSVPLGMDLARQAMQPIIESGCEFIATHVGGTIRDLKTLDTWDLTRISALDLEQSAAERMVESMNGNGDLDIVKVFLPYNDLWAVDFTRAGVNKGAALREMCKMIGVDPSETAAVGDSFNDIPLLEACGLGIAMGGSPDEVQDVAAHVVPTVKEDGLAHAIERYVLPRLRSGK